MEWVEHLLASTIRRNGEIELEIVCREPVCTPEPEAVDEKIDGLKEITVDIANALCIFTD